MTSTKSTNEKDPVSERGDIIDEWMEITGINQTELARLVGGKHSSTITRIKYNIIKYGINGYKPHTKERGYVLMNTFKLNYEDLRKLFREKELSIHNFGDPDTAKKLQEFQDRYFSSSATEIGSTTTESNLHCEFISKYYKLLKWRENKNNWESKPYEIKQIKTDDGGYPIGVFDESFRWYELYTNSGIPTEIEFDFSSDGHQELINTEPTDIKVDYNFSGSRRSQKISVTVPKNPDARRISLQRSVFNAFQPHLDEVGITQENYGRVCTLYLRVPENMSAERISITLDLESIKSMISEMDDPTAHYENLSNYKQRVDVVKSKHASVWTASYENPDPEGALSMQWIMRSRA